MKDIIEGWSGRIQPLVWNLIIVAAAVIIGLAVKFTIKAILNYNKKYTDYSLFRSIIMYFSRPMNHFVPLFMLNLMEPLMVLDKRSDLLFSRTAEIALIISFSIVLISAINIFEDYIYHTYDLNKEDNLKERKIRTQMQFVRRFAGLHHHIYNHSCYIAKF